MSRIRLVVLALVALVALWLGREAVFPAQESGPLEVSELTAAQQGNPKPTRELITRRLDQVDVVEQLRDRAGYERDCGPGEGCVFGQAWSDAVDVAGGRNGCDTRNDVLRSVLSRVEIDPDTRGCVALRGVLRDPYTGGRVRFDRSDDATAVQIDHLYPLSRAWDAGAAEWSAQRRQNFANDPRNLVAADGGQNASKGDQGPGEWMPRYRGFWCAYAARYLGVAVDYQLPVTSADERVLRRVAQRCPSGAGSG